MPLNRNPVLKGSIVQKQNLYNISMVPICLLNLAIGNVEGDVKKSPKSSPEIRKRKPRKAD